jgi:hypothetical protein
MTLTLPWLVGAWVQPQCAGWRRWLLMAGTAAAIIGIFMSGARIFFLQLLILLVVATFSGKMSGPMWIGWALMLMGIGYLVSGDDRLQRVLSLFVYDDVVGRIEGSVNMTFVELLTTYPMGNGLGGGGTSIPFFLLHLIKDPVAMENEYSRLLLEQGLVGLVLWLCFIFWFFRQPLPGDRHPWSLGCRLLWYSCLASFGLAILGTGLMTSIPQTSLLFLSMGFLVVRRSSGQPKGRVKDTANERDGAEPRLKHAIRVKTDR